MEHEMNRFMTEGVMPLSFEGADEKKSVNKLLHRAVLGKNSQEHKIFKKNLNSRIARNI